MNIDTIGKQIESRLVEIREQIGASKFNYDVESIDIEIGGDKLNELAKVNPRKPIIIDDRFHMAYIKDHSYYQYQNHESDINLHPNRCLVNANKVHFYFCTTLVSMSEKGRNHRYRRTTGITNTRLINLQNSPDVAVRLAYCKHCLTILRQTGRAPVGQDSRHKDMLAEWGDAKEYMDCVKELHDGKDISKAIAHTREVFIKTIERKN